MPQLSAGKLRNLWCLCDENGRFKMLAIDQRDSLRRMLAKKVGCKEDEITYDEMAAVKDAITKVLSPLSSAILTDPVYGYPPSIQHIPGRIGLLLAYEETGYEKSGYTGKERKSRLIDGWTAAKAVRAGANAIKLLLPYRPDGSEDTRKHQQELARKVGEECEKIDIPFLLELTGYAIDEDSTDTLDYAKKKPKIVLDSAKEFSKPEYKVDILKLEFPADLKFTKEFCVRVFDDKERPAAYELKQVKEFAKQLDETVCVPWVILSAGVDIKEFIAQVELACEAGASGFLCGRAIWKDAVERYERGNLKPMEDFLSDDGIYNFRRANAAVEKAVPWFQHKPFNGDVKLKGQGSSWYREF